MNEGAVTQGAGHRRVPACGRERADAGLDLVAIQQADRIVAAGQAGDERLEALEALFVQAAQLDDRLGVIVDAQVEARIVLVGMDAQRRGLLAALVAAGGLARGHRREQALGERLAGGGDERLGGRLQDGGAGEHVAGDAEVVVQLMAAPIDAVRSGVSRGEAARADEMQLALGAAIVGVGEAGHDLFGRDAVGEQLESRRAIERIHKRLRRQRADRAPRVHAECADGEEAARDRDAEAAVGVTRDDRPGHRDAPGRQRSSRRATCSASRPAPPAICCRQLVPSATTIASGTLRIAGSRLASAIRSETSWWLAS